MAWGRRAEGPEADSRRVGTRRDGKLRVRLGVMPRCQGSGTAARWAYGPLLAQPPAPAGRVRRVVHLVQRTPKPIVPLADPGLLPQRRARDLVGGPGRQQT